MKKKIVILLVLMIFTFVCAGCGTPSADFESPKAVVDAFLETHSLEGEMVADIYDDLDGKTVCVKTNEKNDPIFTVWSNAELNATLG